MKHFLAVIFSLITFVSQGQEWFSADMVWNTKVFGGMGQFEAFGAIKVRGDTLVNGISAKVLKNYYLGGDGDPDSTVLLKEHVVYERNDSIFFVEDGQSFLAYDFTMVVGDSIEWQPRQVDVNVEIENCKFFFFLDSIDVQEVSGTSSRRQFGRIFSPHFQTYTPIVILEYVGWVAASIGNNMEYENLGYLIPDYNVSCFFDAPGFGQFCSFNSESFNFQFVEEDCGESPLSISRIKTHPLRIFPNPTSDYLSIEGTKDGTITIFSANGIKLKSHHLNAARIDVSALNNGTYIIQIATEEMNRASIFVKQ